MTDYLLTKLKLGLALLLVGCLFLPLAQCSQVPQAQAVADSGTSQAQHSSATKTDPAADPLANAAANTAAYASTEATVKHHYVLQSFSDWLSWLQALSFCAPLLWLLLTTGKPRKVVHSLVLLLLALTALLVVFRVTFWADRLLLGGYLAYGASGGLIMLALQEWGRRLSQAKAVQPRAQI